MSAPTLSVVIPTYNRLDRLVGTLEGLRRQDLRPEEYEVIVVDNGSAVPVQLPALVDGMTCSLLRFETNQERCAARNTGAAAARGEILVFLDDDLGVGPDFLRAHRRAHEEWPGALVGGAVLLPPDSLAHPFVRFRQQLELTGIPAERGVTTSLGTPAGNMSIRRDCFRRLGGFSNEMVGIEDQEFNARHAAAGGTMVYLPEAVAIHWDHALDLRSYCRRTQWAAQCAVALTQRYPDWPTSIERHRMNGPVRWQQEPLRTTLTKLAKQLLGTRPFLDLVFAWVWVLERLLPDSRLLKYHYSALLGVHWLHGFRAGLKRWNETRPATRQTSSPAPQLGESRA